MLPLTYSVAGLRAELIDLVTELRSIVGTELMSSRAEERIRTAIRVYPRRANELLDEIEKHATSGAAARAIDEAKR